SRRCGRVLGAARQLRASRCRCDRHPAPDARPRCRSGRPAVQQCKLRSDGERRMTQILPLTGVRVIDFTQVMLGPCATQMLGDFGADVIKVERPGAGDLSRNFFGRPEEAAMNNVVYASLNRNKRSVELDSK